MKTLANNQPYAMEPALKILTGPAVSPVTSARPYRICSRCVMDTSDPNIAFDDAGVCNHCHNYDRLVRERVRAGETGRLELARLVDVIKKVGAGKSYDCIIGVSGGVDSTYVAWKVKELGLRPLAVHLDNGWDSEIAVSNIITVLKKLGIDLQTEVLDWEQFKDIQLAFLRASVPDAEVPSDHAIFACLYHTATKIGVRHVITGVNIRTETHLPNSWSQGHVDWGYLNGLHRLFGSRRRIRGFPHYSFFQFIRQFRGSHTTINILDYVDYSKKDALVFLKNKLGWRDYGGKHYESLYTRWYQGVYLPRKFGFDKRRSHLSSRLCSGELTRAEALAELMQQPYPLAQQQQDCEYVAKKLNLTSKEFDQILCAQPRRFDEFPSYQKRLNSRWFQNALRIYQIVKFGLLRRPRSI